ncbi:GNAT family N-acetyltransferase [Robiginitalea marina]|uniref:GNAT family N-acetyltransferase n=1 Tax=Robiginitalea marina TaxID=2954105 RepID=A0ABT1AUR2_9FLAO|nr:GNAT family N-acetyltransferase [Robiginitalea marina]MCO5723322.1 GNAT family N-acetyltransferase [Robiginitalea marina]
MVTIHSNPFTSPEFRQKFVAHFVGNEPVIDTGFLSGISFYRHPKFPYYLNLGRNLTKGMNYTLSGVDGTGKPMDDEVFLIYDVPEYFAQKLSPLPANVGLHRVRQYPGYLISLESYPDYDAYFKNFFSRNTRYKLRKYAKRLEQSFEVSYAMHCGPIEREAYDQLFLKFRELLEKRFGEKQIRNNNLEAEEWAFYQEVAYEMIQSNQACLFVIYAHDEPISITLNYFGSGVMFNAITVFDTDFSKFHVGTIAIMKQLEWCYQNGIKIFDFSKGHYDYKSDWATHPYRFEYHIFYNKKSLKSRTTAWLLKEFLTLKQFLRDRNLNERYNKLLFKLRGYHRTAPRAEGKEPLLTELESMPGLDQWGKIDMNDAKYRHLKKHLNSFLFLTQEHLSGVTVFKDRAGEKYIFQGQSTIQKLCFL